MAVIKTIFTTELNDIEVSLNRRTMRNGVISYIVDVWLKAENFEYTDFRSKDIAEAQNHYDDLVQAVKDGWHP